MFIACPSISTNDVSYLFDDSFHKFHILHPEDFILFKWKCICVKKEAKCRVIKNYMVNNVQGHFRCYQFSFSLVLMLHERSSWSKIIKMKSSSFQRKPGFIASGFSCYALRNHWLRLIKYSWEALATSSGSFIFHKVIVFQPFFRTISQKLLTGIQCTSKLHRRGAVPINNMFLFSEF